MTSTRTVKDNPEASHTISSSRHHATDHQQAPEQQQTVLLPHPDHTTLQHGSGVVHATAAAALPAATPAPGMPAAPAAAVTGRSGATQSLSRLDAALAKQQYALVSFEGYLAWCLTWHLGGTLSRVQEAGMPAQIGAADSTGCCRSNSSSKPALVLHGTGVCVDVLYPQGPLFQMMMNDLRRPQRVHVCGDVLLSLCCAGATAAHPNQHQPSAPPQERPAALCGPAVLGQHKPQHAPTPPEWHVCAGPFWPPPANVQGPASSMRLQPHSK
jgi:hypothetical protein